MIENLESLKGKTKLNFYQTISSYYVKCILEDKAKPFNLKKILLFLKMLKLLAKIIMNSYYE